MLNDAIMLVYVIYGAIFSIRHHRNKYFAKRIFFFFLLENVTTHCFNFRTITL